jgi:hypothetical protein
MTRKYSRGKNTAEVKGGIKENENLPERGPAHGSERALCIVNGVVLTDGVEISRAVRNNGASSQTHEGASTEVLCLKN